LSEFESVSAREWSVVFGITFKFAARSLKISPEYRETRHSVSNYSNSDDLLHYFFKAYELIINGLKRGRSDEQARISETKAERQPGDDHYTVNILNSEDQMHRMQRSSAIAEFDVETYGDSEFNF
jgi:hypothetical protein